MKRIIITTFIVVCSLLLPEVIKAEVTLPAIVSSNMVLQRNTTIELWGWADANEKIAIKTSWLKETLQIEADENGIWRIQVKTTNSKEPQVIRIESDSSKIILDNILFGEVWLCSGQSNMQQPMKGYDGQPVFGSVMATARSANSNLRLFSVDKAGSKTPLQDVEGYMPWQEASPENVLNFSALAYYFGQQLQEILDVPVGLIHSSFGGSFVQAWMSKEVLDDYEEFSLDNVDITKKQNGIRTALFNAMINPLMPYTIKGVIWYQGETNRFNPESYKKLFPAMVKDWRQRWGIGDFPFYYVQIAPYKYNYKKSSKPVNSAFLRESQLQCLDSIPNSGIAITMDIGTEYEIHPPKKKEVADRLLFNALNRTYGYTSVDCAAPIFDYQEIKDDGILLKFKNAETGLYTYGDLEGFEVAGEDKVFYPAKAEIVNRMDVFVTCEEVAKPVAVRYAWVNWVVGSLYDVNLLPASSFRTDNWEEVTPIVN